MTLNPTQAQKFLWLGLSRTLEDVDEDDIPADAVQINSLSLTNIIGRTIQTDIELENTINEPITMTLAYTDNGFRVFTTTIDFEAEETLNLQHTFTVLRNGNREITAIIGNQTETETITIL